MISKELHARTIEKLEEVIAIAEDHFQTTFKFPTIVYKKRGTTAGTADTRTQTLDFNAGIFEQNVEDFLVRTVPHEMAHLIDAQMNPETHVPVLKGYRRNGRPIYKRSIHGFTWKRIMVLIGADPARCHSYDVSTVSRRSEKFVWICSTHGTEMKLGPKQHRRQLNMRTTGCYVPRKTRCGSICRSKFQYGSVIAPVVPVAIAADEPKKIIRTTPAGGHSKKSQAADIYRRAGGVRRNFINMCTLELAMKKSTASTYHHNFKSNKWSV